MKTKDPVNGTAGHARNLNSLKNTGNIEGNPYWNRENSNQAKTVLVMVAFCNATNELGIIRQLKFCFHFRSDKQTNDLFLTQRASMEPLKVLWNHTLPDTIPVVSGPSSVQQWMNCYALWSVDTNALWRPKIWKALRQSRRQGHLEDYIEPCIFPITRY